MRKPPGCVCDAAARFYVPRPHVSGALNGPALLLSAIHLPCRRAVAALGPGRRFVSAGPLAGPTPQLGSPPLRSCSKRAACVDATLKKKKGLGNVQPIWVSLRSSSRQIAPASCVCCVCSRLKDQGRRGDKLQRTARPSRRIVHQATRFDLIPDFG